MADAIKSATRFFLDRAEVKDAVDRGTRVALSKFGAFVRRRSRSSIRKRKAISQPGQPPTNREGSLRRLIFFAFDPEAKSVVIGPVPFKQGKAPALLEYGGTVPGNGRVIFITREPGRDNRGQFVTRGRQRLVLNGDLVYRPRPFMQPAYEAELPKAPDLFKDRIR